MFTWLDYFWYKNKARTAQQKKRKKKSALQTSLFNKLLRKLVIHTLANFFSLHLVCDYLYVVCLSSFINKTFFVSEYILYISPFSRIFPKSVWLLALCKKVDTQLTTIKWISRGKQHPTKIFPFDQERFYNVLTKQTSTQIMFVFIIANHQTNHVW